MSLQCSRPAGLLLLASILQSEINVKETWPNNVTSELIKLWLSYRLRAFQLIRAV